MDAGVLLGAIGTAVALGSLAFGYFAWRVERRDRLAEIAEERETRKAQLKIEQRRLAAELADREARQHAEITAQQGGFRTEGSRRAYDFTLTNLGPSYAKHVKTWLTDQREEVISDTALLGPLDVGHERAIVLRIPLDTVKRSETERAVLWVSWYGADKQLHKEPSKLEVRMA